MTAHSRSMPKKPMSAFANKCMQTSLHGRRNVYEVLLSIYPAVADAGFSADKIGGRGIGFDFLA